MPDQPKVSEKIDIVRAVLDGLNEDADRFRAVAWLARHGELPLVDVVDSVEEAHIDLAALLDEIDRTLDALTLGHPDFAPLLGAQRTAMALLESIGNSLGILSQYPLRAPEAPATIAPALLVAAE